MIGINDASAINAEHRQLDQTPALYHVELIVFQNEMMAGLYEETWPSYPALPQLKGAIELIEPSNYVNNQTDPELSFTLLSEASLKLKEAVKALDSNQNYSILLHQAWLQKINNLNTAQLIHIHSKLDTDELTDLPSQGQDPQILTFESWKINGTIKLSQTNYFNADIDLLLTIPMNDFDALYPVAKNIAPKRDKLSFRMQQQRRMRCNKLYYFDHPLFGVLLSISKQGDV